MGYLQWQTSITHSHAQVKHTQCPRVGQLIPPLAQAHQEFLTHLQEHNYNRTAAKEPNQFFFYLGQIDADANKTYRRCRVDDLTMLLRVLELEQPVKSVKMTTGKKD